MAVTDWKSPGTQSSEDRNLKAEWTNPTDAATINATDAYQQLAKSEYGDWLRLTNYGFTTGDIPEGATIDGIEVEVTHDVNIENTAKDNAFYLRKSTGQASDNFASASFWAFGGDTEANYGGAADDLGFTGDDSDVRSSSFGVDLSVFNDSSSSPTPRVDCIRIRVHYTSDAPVIGDYYNGSNWTAFRVRQGV